MYICVCVCVHVRVAMIFNIKDASSPLSFNFISEVYTHTYMYMSLITQLITVNIIITLPEAWVVPGTDPGLTVNEINLTLGSDALFCKNKHRT